MEAGDGADEVEAKAIACGMAAVVEAHETFDDALAIGGGDPGPIVGNGKPDVVGRAAQAEPDRGAGRRMALSVFE